MVGKGAPEMGIIAALRGLLSQIHSGILENLTRSGLELESVHQEPDSSPTHGLHAGMRRKAGPLTQ